MANEKDIYRVSDSVARLNKMMKDRGYRTDDDNDVISEDRFNSSLSSIVKLEAAIRCLENGEEIDVSNIRKEVKNVDLEQIVESPKFIAR